MSFIFSQALAEAYLGDSFSATDAYVQSSLNPTPKQSLSPGKTTGHSRLSRFGITCELLTGDRGEEWLTWWLEDSHAKMSVWPEPGLDSKVHAAGCGLKWPESSARCDPGSPSSKTAPPCEPEDLLLSSATLPPRGTMRNGAFSARTTLEHPIVESASGFWPTPTVSGNYNRKGASATSGDGLATAVRKWPTPTTTTSYKGWSPNHKRAHTNDRLDYAAEREGFTPGQQTPPMRLNPDWVEFLMGWPIGHTGLKPLATAKYHEWLQQHSPF